MLIHGAFLPRFCSSTEAGTKLFLHVGPSGDCWTGTSIFAAKHLQPDYVKSVPLPAGVCVETLVEIVEQDSKLAQDIYDGGELPDELLKQVRVARSEGVKDED